MLLVRSNKSLDTIFESHIVWNIDELESYITSPGCDMIESPYDQITHYVKYDEYVLA